VDSSPAPWRFGPHLDIVTSVDNHIPAGGLHLEAAVCGSDVRVVTVLGEVDTLTAPDLASCLNVHLVAAQRVVLDLDGVQFMGSAGLSVLAKANELALRDGRELRLVCNSRSANRALEVTGLRDQFTFFDNVSDALQS